MYCKGMYLAERRQDQQPSGFKNSRRSLSDNTPAVHALAVEIDRWTTDGGVGRVSILFNRRVGATAAEPTLRPVFPLPQEQLDALATSPWPSSRLPIYRMDRAKLLLWLVGQRIFVLLFRALAESLASEHASRRAAMQSAERNIIEHCDGLMSAYRQKRQEAVTRELLDILAGFEALSKKPGATI